MKRKFLVTFLIICLLSTYIPAVAGMYVDLQPGDAGVKVAFLRQRLYDLGYLDAFEKGDDSYTQGVAEAVQAFEQRNNLPVTGIATQAVQQLLFSKEAKGQPLDEQRTYEDLSYDGGPAKTISLPARDAEGFLPPGSTPFVHADREDGRWMYLSDALQVDISRYHQDANNIEWYEAFITTRGEEKPYTVLSKREGKVVQPPKALAELNGSVFAITDDYFGYRVKNEKSIGVILRNSKVLYEKTRVENRSNLQPLEVLAMFQDGTLRTFDSDAYTGQEYLDMGVTDTWAFGPVLVQGGIVPRYYYSKEYHSYREPRCAFGMIEQGKYAALVVTGRKDDSRGAYFKWLAEKMLDMGCTEALNMDGGNTVALLFMGDMINHSTKTQKTSVRSVSGIIGFGTGAEYEK